MMNTNYYCYDCARQCSVISREEIDPFGYFPEWGHQSISYKICEQCGSFEVEEKDHENTI